MPAVATTVEIPSADDQGHTSRASSENNESLLASMKAPSQNEPSCRPHRSQTSLPYELAIDVGGYEAVQ